MQIFVFASKNGETQERGQKNAQLNIKVSEIKEKIPKLACLWSRSEGKLLDMIK